MTTPLWSSALTLAGRRASPTYQGWLVLAQRCPPYIDDSGPCLMCQGYEVVARRRGYYLWPALSAPAQRKAMRASLLLRRWLARTPDRADMGPDFEAALTAAGWSQRSQVCWSRGGR